MPMTIMDRKGASGGPARIDDNDPLSLPGANRGSRPLTPACPERLLEVKTPNEEVRG